VISDVRNNLPTAPFEPFAIITSSGHRYEVPTAHHAGIHPAGNRVVIWFDDGGGVTLSALHIAAVEKCPRPEKNGGA
jgi:hypothetical protein